MEGATQTAVFQAPVSQISAAMRAAAADQAIAPFVVLEDHQILAEQPHRLDRAVAGEFIHQRGRLPIAPHQVARRRIGAGAAHQMVLFGAEHRTRPFADDYR
jgi:hypothetical protein